MDLLIIYQSIIDLNFEFSPLLSPLAKDFLESILHQKPTQRATLNDLLQHPLLSVAAITNENFPNPTAADVKCETFAFSRQSRAQTPKFGGKLRQVWNRSRRRRRDNSTSSAVSTTSRASGSTMTSYNSGSRLNNNCISMADPAWTGVCLSNLTHKHTANSLISTGTSALRHLPSDEGSSVQLSPLFLRHRQIHQSRRPPLESSNAEAERLYACLRNRVAWHARERDGLCWILRWAEHMPHSCLLYTTGVLADSKHELAALAAAHGLLVADGTACVLDKSHR